MTRRIGLMCAALALVGAPGCDGGPSNGGQDAGCPPGRICLTDGGGVDTGTVAPSDAGDAGTTPSTCPLPPRPGLDVGAACRRGVCETPLQCLFSGIPALRFDELFTGGDRAIVLPDGGYFRESQNPDAAVTWPEVPLRLYPGGACTVACQPATTTAPDTCNACSTCQTTFGIGALAGIPYDIFFQTGEGDPDDGVCRPNCDYNSADSGDCGAGFQCDPGSSVCEEACQTDDDCNANLAVLDGDLVVYVDPQGRATCNAQGRCNWTAPTTGGRVGDACERSSDCAPDVGLCLRGGTCATYQCGTPMTPFTCDPTLGACISFGGNTSICVQGCATPADCHPGNACSPLTRPAGTFTGICFPACETSAECRTDELCDIPEGDTYGECAPPCDAPTDCPASDEECEIPTGASTGFCHSSCTTNADCNTTGGYSCHMVGGTYGFCRMGAGPMIDGGVPDAGSVTTDAGTPAVDAGTPAVDAGTPAVDAGTPAVDAGTPAVDAGVDGGTPP